MSKTESGKTQISRRTLAKGAAWSVPVIATAAAAPAASASVGASQNYSTSVLNYTCAASLFGSSIPLGTWTAQVSSTLPSSAGVGDSLPPSPITAHVVTGDTSQDTLVALGYTQITALSSSASYTVADVEGGTDRSSDLSVDASVFPIELEKGKAVTTDASGTAQEETVAAAGNVVVSVGDFTVNLTAHNPSSDSDLPVPVTCTLDDGQDAVLASIPVS